MNKANLAVLVLVLAAFLVGVWAGDGLRSPAAAQSAAPEKQPSTSAPSRQPMFQEVVVPDKTGEQGAVYMIYHGPGQICAPSQWVVPLKPRPEKADTEKPAVKKEKSKPRS
jgi:hypothetical protein